MNRRKALKLADTIIMRIKERHGHLRQGMIEMQDNAPDMYDEFRTQIADDILEASNVIGA